VPGTALPRGDRGQRAAGKPTAHRCMPSLPVASTASTITPLLARRERRRSAWKSSARFCSPWRDSSTKQAGTSTTSSSFRRGTFQDPVPDHDAPSQAPHGAHCQDQSSPIGPISWHLKQRVGKHLFHTGMAFKFDRPRTQGQCFFRNRSTYTTTEQILHRWGQFHRPPFQCGSGRVATVVLWDRYTCELCNAPVRPTRCPLIPRQSCVFSRL